MSKIILKKNGTDYLFGLIPIHYPADRVYLDGDTTKTVQDKVARKADLTNLDLTGTTNTTGSTIASGTYFYLNGVLVKAKTAIANGATFTLNTNYEVMTAGGLNRIKRYRIATGLSTITRSSNDWVYKTVTFDYAFTEAPLVTISTPGSTDMANVMPPMLDNISATGFRVGYYAGTGTVSFRWQAIGTIN